MNLKKARKKLAGIKAGMRLCDAYAELVRENEELKLRVMNAEARLARVKREIDDDDEDM